MATNVLGLHTFTASEPWDFNIVNDNSLKIDNGVKTAMQGRAAHNLLDNSDFRNPVNQRGKNTYSDAGNEYTIDRWKTQYGTNISIENGYINIWGNWDLKQRLKKPLGIIYTLAAKVRINFTGDHTPAIGIDGGQKVELDAPIDEWRIYAKQIDISSITDETIEIQLAPNGGSSSGSISVEWVALYEGAYDASTLPAYQPKGYAAELAECQRYYRRGAQAVTIGKLYTAGGIFSLWFPQMRINPTINILEILSQGWGNVDASNYTQGWGGAYGSWHYINFISSITEDVGKTIIIKYENSADL